jgi:predicted flap endonuclease-1-like 5' DNA nuclease
VIITALVAAALGAALGWLVRNSTDSTRTRVLEELYSRKLRLAEQLRDEAIKSLNANRVEMAGYAARFEALDTEIGGLREALVRTETAHAAAAEELAHRNGEISSCREAAAEGMRASAEARQLVESANQRVASAEHAMDQAYDELMSTKEKLAGTEQLLNAANEHGVELAQDVLLRELALEDLRGALARSNDELESASEGISRRDSEIEALRELAAGVPPLRAALVERDARLERQAEQELRQLARIEALTPLAEGYPGLRAECDALAAHDRELESQLALALASAAELPPLQEELRQVQMRADSTAMDLERERARTEQLSAATHATEEEVRVTKREASRLEKEFQQLQVRADSTGKELERERTRREQLTATAQTRDDEARVAKREFHRLDKELQGAAANAVRLNTRIATLEAQLAERDGRIKALTPVSHARSGRGTLRPQSAKQPVRSSASDDLKRIAGIGPVLAKKLRRLGVASFDQLATLTRTDIEALSEKLGVAAERIRREGWITSARVEVRARNGN